MNARPLQAETVTDDQGRKLARSLLLLQSNDTSPQGVAAAYVYNDRGRAAAGYKGHTGDCVTRAIAITTGLPYATVYDQITARTQAWLNASRTRRAARSRARGRVTARTGAHKDVYHPWLLKMGWMWQPTMEIGGGCRVHLCAAELSPGWLIVKVSRHLVAVIDGVIHDTHDCSRGGQRCVYGYYYRPENAAVRSGSLPEDFNAKLK